MEWRREAWAEPYYRSKVKLIEQREIDFMAGAASKQTNQPNQSNKLLFDGCWWLVCGRSSWRHQIKSINFINLFALLGLPLPPLLHEIQINSIIQIQSVEWIWMIVDWFHEVLLLLVTSMN